MKLDRIDFGNNNKCYRCRRPLSKMSYVAIDNNGTEVHFGRECVKNQFPNIDNSLPNFTRAGNVNDYENSSNEIGHKRNNEGDQLINEKMIIEYIRLRCEFLSDFKGIEYKPIAEKYIKYKQSLLDDDDMKYLFNLIKKVNKKLIKFGYKNLIACYMAKQKMSLLIEKNSNNFTNGILIFLKENYYLTKKQISKVNESIKKINGIDGINGKWFYNIETAHNRIVCAPFGRVPQNTSRAYPAACQEGNLRHFVARLR